MLPRYLMRAFLFILVLCILSITTMMFLSKSSVPRINIREMPVKLGDIGSSETTTANRNGKSETEVLLEHLEKMFKNSFKAKGKTVYSGGFMNDDFLENNRNGSFPKETVCHYTGLRKELHPVATNGSHGGVACKAHEPSNDACEQANAKYGRPGVMPAERRCGETAYEDICKFSPSQTEGEPAVLLCSAKVCGNSAVSYGTVDPTQGILGWKDVGSFSTERILELVSGTKKEGYDFAFLKCGSILQALVFEPTITTNGKWKPSKRININMVVVDSISRPHFYRMLPSAVAAMRDVVYDMAVNATVLDYELFQAIGQHTFENIRTLFSGVVRGNENFSSKVKQKLEPLGVDVLYKKYKDLGYQTMFQEDLCWLDAWGIMLNSLEYRSDSPRTTEQYRQRWKEFEDIVGKLYIDHYGLTHFSCKVCDKYGRTNHYDYPDQICLNGKFFSRYFLEYLAKVHRAIDEKKDAAPMISYQHFNTGHTPGGTRIRNMDAGLASFIHSMARDPNTITIMLSDHGHTRTSYGGTFEGKFELYNPFLFIIVPHHVANLLGQETMAAMVENQHRLLTTMEIHNAMMALHDDEKMSSGDHRQAGIFTLLPGNRTCGDLDIAPLAKCRCHVDDMKFKDNSKKHKWLAEYALGNINNAIQDQFIKGQNREKGKQKAGFGHCNRLIGKSIRNVIERQLGNTITVSFDLHVAPPPGFEEDEVFQIAIKRSITNEWWLEFAATNRHTMYNKFASCRDQSVDIKLCVCDVQRGNASAINFTEEYTKQIRQPVFGQEPEIKALHGDCLLLIKRSHDRITTSYEIANFCVGKHFEVVVSGKADQVIVSASLPMTLYFSSKSVYYVMSTVRKILNHSYFDESFNVRIV